MAQRRPNSLPSTQYCTDTEKTSRCAIQEKSEKIQPKINRLKRVKRTGASGREHSSLIKTESGLFSDPIFNCEETFSPDNQTLCISTHPFTRSRGKDGAHGSAPKSEQFLLKGLMEAHLEDLSKNTNNELHTQVQSLTKPQSLTEETFHFSSHPKTSSQNPKVMTTGERLDLLELYTQNLHFPVRQFVSIQKPFKREYIRPGDISSTSLLSMVAKRKQRVDPGNDEHLQKHSNQKLDKLENHDRPKTRMTNRNRLSSRCRKKQHTSPAHAAVHRPQQNKNDTNGGDVTGDDMMEGDVPWSEKYRPCCSDEVVGNSAAVKKLYSWLKEWRVKADVDERRKRREEHMMQKKNNGSWDCGDFEGDPMTETHMGEPCNTVLIHGPTGVGKTATVYACAQELGFKIFEVNSSSLRSGHVVLSQLKECTQSHLVGAPHSSCTTHKPATLRETARQKVITTSKKTSALQRKKRAVPVSVTIKHFFRKTEKPIDTGTNAPHGVGVSGISLTESEIEEEPVLTSKSSSEKKDRKAAVSLMLFEEVDVIFDDDVGFFSAIRSLMSTSKRPIILTTNDAKFGLTFHGDFKEIRFKTPSVESVSSYLQCVCVVEGVNPDPEHISLIVQNNKGDVRRSILDLELWVCGGGGNTPCQLQKNTLACFSYAEMENTGCMQVLVDCWRKGQSLLYSNFDLLLAPSIYQTSAQSTFDQRTDCPTFLNPAVPFSAESHRLKQRKLSRRKVKTIQDKKLRLSELDSLAKFLNTMSFLDSHLSQKVSGVCKSGLFRVKVSDSLLDELSEEAVWTPDMERWIEIQAVVEGLGFCTCRSEVHEMMRIPGEFKGQRMEMLNVSVEDTTSNSGVWKTRDTLLKVLYSTAFQYNGNKPAVVTDYLPTLRFIWKMERMKSHHEPRFPQYLRDIGLLLPKSTLNLLAAELR